MARSRATALESPEDLLALIRSGDPEMRLKLKAEVRKRIFADRGLLRLRRIRGPSPMSNLSRTCNGGIILDGERALLLRVEGSFQLGSLYPRFRARSRFRRSISGGGLRDKARTLPGPATVHDRGRRDAKAEASRSYREAYRVLRTYPIHGEFIAMQHLTDLNNSPVLNFDENDFVVAGPGALDGMQKCFGLRPDPELASEIINQCVKHQDGMFSDLGLEQVALFGRRLSAIDCQNLFCETDKYARVAHPQYNLQRSEIKQQFKSQGPLLPPFFPPKWGVQLNCLKIS
jgi:hypothetical protein